MKSQGMHIQWCWEKSAVHPLCFPLGRTALTVLCEWFSLTLPTVYPSINVALKPALQQGPSKPTDLLPKPSHHHTRPGQQILSPEKAKVTLQSQSKFHITNGTGGSRPVRTKPAGWDGAMLWGRKLHWLPGALTALCFQQLHQTNVLTRTWQLSTPPFHLASLFPSKHMTQASDALSQGTI